MRAESATIHVAQDQINAVGSHDVIDVSAANGLNPSVSGTPVELEMLTETLDLRTDAHAEREVARIGHVHSSIEGNTRNPCL